MTLPHEAREEALRRWPEPAHLGIRSVFEAGAEWQRAQAPAGWRLVPEEPTMEMTEAGFEKEIEGKEWGRVSSAAADIWQAMLAASPPPPVSDPSTKKGGDATCKSASDPQSSKSHKCDEAPGNAMPGAAPSTGSAPVGEKVCPTCDGTGGDLSSFTCATCGGTGRVPEEGWV